MYRVASLILAGVVVVAGLVVYAEPPADPGDDPPTLKKKGAPDGDDGALKPPADDNDKDKDKDKKPDAPKPDGDKGKPRPDPDEVLKDVAKSMHSAEEHLAKKELGDPTRQAQEDALKGLDSLIDLSQNPPDDQGAQANKPDNKDNKPDNKDNKQGNQGNKPDDKPDHSSNPGAQKPDASGSPGSKTGPMNRQGQRRSRTRKNQSKGGAKPDSGNQAPGEKQPGMTGDQPPQDPGSKSNPGGNGGDKPGAEKPDDPIAKLVTARWGELTPTLREEQKEYASLGDMKSMPEYEKRVAEFRKAAAQSDRKGN